MSEAKRDAKLQEMQKYIPFLKRVIDRLKVNNEHQADNPREGQLKKMEMLNDLLTNKAKKIRMETLEKCEAVIIRLQAKIEMQTNFLQNEDSVLNNIKLKQQKSDELLITNKNVVTKEFETTFASIEEKHQESKKTISEDISGPASPPPEIILDDVEQPVEIPTERRCSPILIKEIKKNTHEKNAKQIKGSHRMQESKLSKDEHVLSVKEKGFPADKKHAMASPSKHNTFQEQHSHQHPRQHYDSRLSGSHHHANRLGTNSSLPKEKPVHVNKTHSGSQNLQTVKVVITEPLPAHIKQQHFPTSNIFMPRSSICHNNLKTLPQESPATEENDAYSPEELWEQYNVSHKKQSSTTPTTPPVFSRLGAKTNEDSLNKSTATTKSTGRYTPIPDVLKSPPLSASDINNLLLESGADKISNDISEIGSRRPLKTEESLLNNSFELVRKKLAQTARMNNSQLQESPRTQVDRDEPNISPLPHERLALKYNPHPRQERLQSISSTDGSECSTQSKINDPRLKSKLHSPVQVPNSNVNVLPAINLNDPRLKRQNMIPPHPTPSAAIKGFPGSSPLSYGSRTYSRISRESINPFGDSKATAPARRPSIIQLQYSSEENWDSDEDEKSRPQNKVDPRLIEREQQQSRIESKFEKQPPIIRNNMGQPRFPVATRTEKQLRPSQNRSDSKTKKPKNKLVPAVTLTVPNPPKSDSEEDWDAELEDCSSNKPQTATSVPELSINETNAITNVGLQFSMERSPITPFHTHLPPKPLISPVHTISSPVMPTVMTQIPYHQPTYPLTGAHNNFPMQNAGQQNRFSSLLNDKSERLKYFEAKKQKANEPRTYKEFREARERAQAQEAAQKRAIEEEEAKKRAAELKEQIIINASNKREPLQKDAQSKKPGETKKDQKFINQTNKSSAPSQKDNKKTPAREESSLDKMYRTQNFNSKFPKPNASFKIPKKKTEEKVKDETTTTKTNGDTAKSSTNTHNDKPKSIIKDKEDIVTTGKQDPKVTEDSIKSDNNKKPTDAKNIKHLETVSKENIEEKQEDASINKDKTPNITNSHKQAKEKPKENQDENEISLEDHDGNFTPSENNAASKEFQTNNSEEFNIKENPTEEGKNNSRDPRCRPKPQLMAEGEIKKSEIETHAAEENFNVMGNITITSSNSEIVLMPKQTDFTALEKFNKLTQELTPKPQRVLRRRNTMVVFDSAPLVDKEKLRKANALLFEDVQEEEKRKRKLAEEERQNARRNKHLEEMFKKTDDNCTVSTQNIIMGKRRTRATINFNETVNAIHVFKHINLKDTAVDNLNVTPPAQTAKSSRSSAKSKAKNLEVEENSDATIEDENKAEKEESESKPKDKPMKKRAAANKKSSVTAKNSEDSQAASTAINEAGFTPIPDEEHQNCAVSSTSTENSTENHPSSSTSSTNRSLKKEIDDNEPSSTANKSNNPTPTPEANVLVLNEIVDQILKPNADREHIISLLGQILSEEKLELIKSLIESSNSQNEQEESEKPEVIKQEKNKSFPKDNKATNRDYANEDEDEDEIPLKSFKVTGGKKMVMPKKKRSELDRLNEDIRDMFICKGVLTATGRRMCTIMSKEVETVATKAINPKNEKEHINKRNEENLKPPTNTRPLRRSLRSCNKTQEDNDEDDNQSIISRTTEESVDDFNTTTDNSNSTDSTPLRKMPILKPHTPIKIAEEVSTKSPMAKKVNNKRKFDGKFSIKMKRLKSDTNYLKQNLEHEEKESEIEEENDEDDEEEEEQQQQQQQHQNNIKELLVKNTNINCHNQSKFTTWCMICEKKMPANSSSLHYKTHHGENYISRMAPVLLQKFKQGKHNQPLFGVKKAQKQPSWFYRCPFCLKYFNTPMPLWLEHFQNHTVEYRYECSKCHRCNNRRLAIVRHIKNCEGATIINSAVKLTVPTVIQAHVCHLCNFIQLRRVNLERHYMEQHALDKKTAELLGYTITLFDVENVECVTEDRAVEKEKEAWKSIEKDEQVIDIDDDEEMATASQTEEEQNKKSPAKDKQNKKQKNNGPAQPKNNEDNEKPSANKVTKTETVDLNKTGGFNSNKDKLPTETQIKSDPLNEEIPVSGRPRQYFNKKKKTECSKDSLQANNNQTQDPPTEQKKKSNELFSNDFVMVNEEGSVQNIQDELLALAAEAAEKEGEIETAKANSNIVELEIQSSIIHANDNETTPEPLKAPMKTTMSNLISNSIDAIYKRADSKCKSTDLQPAEAKNVCQTASNAFMPTRDESNYSPTIQILAQSIINIEEQAKVSDNVARKPITMAERLSQRFRDLANTTSLPSTSTAINIENPFERLVRDTLDYSDIIVDPILNETSCSRKVQENAFDKLINDTVLELEKEKEKNTNDLPKQVNANDITVISDDEDWEDIEITETAPTAASTSAGNIQKSKNKGLFQKFGIFKGNNTKSKKHLPPMVYLPKKKTKGKQSSLQANTISLPSPTTTSTTSANTTTVNTTLTSSSNVVLPNSSYAHLGFKPLTNIMDDLLPDSPCNDPIDLVPELAPLEPLQDLNDISSILDSNLSAININPSEHQNSIEDALDFISEQQDNDKQTKGIKANKINNISHVGYSVQSSGENAFKFYCLLENCTFLYSSDCVGLEAHFMCEHAQIKWNGYCLMCQAQCLPDVHTSEKYSIAKEIRHMMDQHANKPQLDLNTDSTQHSTTSSQGSEERPKIKLRRMTGDCLSKSSTENVTNSTEAATSAMTMLGALLVAKPKPPTKEMPPQPQMPLTEPLLLGSSETATPFTNVNNDFLITSVTSSAQPETQTPLQISSVISLNKHSSTTITSTNTTTATNSTVDSTPEQMQVPKIFNVRTLAPSKAASLWSQQIEDERHLLLESAAESLEVSRILANAGKPSTERELRRNADDSPIIVAETVPLAQAQTGDFVVTQTVSAQYNEFSSTALGFNISIAPTTSAANVAPNSGAIPSNNIISRQYKCMGSCCKFMSRVPVAMSDHLRFHERRNFSNKRDYLDCGFCLYSASDVEDYMNHADQFHIIKQVATSQDKPTKKPTDQFYTIKQVATSYEKPTVSNSKVDTANSLTKKIQNILSNSIGSTNVITGDNNQTPASSNQTPQQVQDSYEVYLKKLRDTIHEIVRPTGLADDKLYRCVVKNCLTQLTESTFLSHIIYHISANGDNPNNYVFKCPHCTTQYHRAAGIKAHIKNHTRNRYFCYLCEDTSTNPGQLLKHFSEKHWHTLNLYTKELLKPTTSIDGSDLVLDSGYYVAYTQELSEEEVRKFGEKLILEWQRKKSGSKTHFKSSEIDLLPMTAIFQREVNCGECEYKTKVRTNMFRHLQMHKQNPGFSKTSGVSNVQCVDPVNPVPCLNSSERFFDKMTNLASSSLIPSSHNVGHTCVIPYGYVDATKRYTCGCQGCNYHTISEELFRVHLSTLHSTCTFYRCFFCKEEICKRGISIDRIINHLRFHGISLFRCEECNYLHYLRYVVERHVNDRHASLIVNIVSHSRSSEDNTEGKTTTMAFAGKKYKETLDNNQSAQTSASVTRSSNSESSAAKPQSSLGNNNKGKGKWLCDVCGQSATTLNQIQSHCQQQHGVKNQYKCAHCNFGSQQLSQILVHIDEKHDGKTREARNIYHKSVSTSDEVVADTRPLWQRNDPTRVRHIRGILMEDEELSLTEDVEDDNEDQEDEVEIIIAAEEPDEEVNDAKNYVSGYEFGCYFCTFKTQKFAELKTQHYTQVHNSKMETAKPFWFCLHRRVACPECRTFIGNFTELQQHLQNIHKKTRFYAADITMAENDDVTQRILCGHCSFHCANAELLQRHYLRVQHWPQDVRIDNNAQIADILSLGQAEVSYQCTLCTDIFPNRVATAQHACDVHAGEENFSFMELSSPLIYRCNTCCFTSTLEIEVLRHMVDHYGRFKICYFCHVDQKSFNAYMQHCYAEHRTDIQKFKSIYPLREIRKFLLQMLIVFSSGLVVNKRNLLNTKYGRTEIIEELYEDMYKISQQPPIPRLSIARLVARKSIEAQQKHVDFSTATPQDEDGATHMHSKSISKRRRTETVSWEDGATPKPKITLIEGKTGAPTIRKRRTTVDQENLLTQQQQQQKQNEFNVPLQFAKISKRRRTVAVDRDTLFSSNLTTNDPNSLLTERDSGNKNRKTLFTTLSPQYPAKETNTLYPLNLDMEPFSFYGIKTEPLDLTKIYTKVAIGGIKTPLTIDKFKTLFNIECQLKLTKCDEDNETFSYIQYKHIKKACPASHKVKFN